MRYEFIPPSVGGIVGCGPCCVKGNKASLLLNTVEPSVPQVPFWHGFIDRICFFKRTLVCPGELLQAGSTIYRLPRRQGLIFVAGAVYEMACGHCRRPRKEIVAFNLAQLCGIRGLSRPPKSKGLPKVVLRGSKMAPEIGSWEPQNSPSHPEAHPGRGLVLPAPRVFEKDKVFPRAH